MCTFRREFANSAKSCFSPTAAWQASEGRGQWLPSLPSDALTTVNRLTLKTESFLTDVNLIARPDLSWGLASVFLALLRLWEPLWGSEYADRLFDPGSKIEQITQVCFGKLLTYFPRHLSTKQETRNGVFQPVQTSRIMAPSHTVRFAFILASFCRS